MKTKIRQSNTKARFGEGSRDSFGLVENRIDCEEDTATLVLLPS